MSTLQQLIDLRPVAGARYVAAVAEFRAALADLAAIDRLLANANVGALPLPTFGGPLPDPIPMRHPTFNPNEGGNLVDDINAAFAIRLAAFGTPDEE